MNPNEAFKRRNDKLPPEQPYEDLMFAQDKHIHMTCRGCGEKMTIHLKAYALFQPSVIACSCGGYAWHCTY